MVWIFYTFYFIAHPPTFVYPPIIRDEDLLDSVIPAPQFGEDALIPIDRIQWAVGMLHNSTAFLGDISVLGENIPVVQTSVNRLIAGADRTLSNLFDLTSESLFLYKTLAILLLVFVTMLFVYFADWATNLSSTPLESVSAKKQVLIPTY